MRERKIVCLHDPVQFKVFDVRGREHVIVTACRICCKVLSIKPVKQVTKGELLAPLLNY